MRAEGPVVRPVACTAAPDGPPPGAARLPCHAGGTRDHPVPHASPELRATPLRAEAGVTQACLLPTLLLVVPATWLPAAARWVSSSSPWTTTMCWCTPASCAGRCAAPRAAAAVQRVGPPVPRATYLCAALLRRRAPGRVAITVALSETPRRGTPADEQRAWHAGVSLTLKTTPCVDGALERRRLLRAHRKGPQRQG